MNTRWSAALLSCVLLAAGSAAAGEILDNAKVEKMVTEGISLDVILKLLEPTANPGEQAGGNLRFEDSTESMISLQQAGKKGNWPQEDIKKLQIKVAELARRDQKNLKELVDIFWNVVENADEKEYEDKMRVLVREGKRVVPFLLKGVDQESDRKRAGTADVLGRVGDNSEIVQSMLMSLIMDRAKPVREKSARAVAMLAGPKTAEQLIGKTANRSLKLDGVALALGYIGDDRAIQPLTGLLTNSLDSDTRVCAAFALGEMRAKASLARDALLEAVLDDRDPNLRAASAVALGKVGEKRAPSYIIKSFHRYRPGRMELVRTFANFKDITVLDFLVDQLDATDDPKLRRAMSETLKVMTDESADDADGWRGIIEVLRTRPDWTGSASSSLPRVPDVRGLERTENTSDAGRR